MQDQLETLTENSPTLSLREYVDILRRRRAIILQTFVIVLVVGVLYTLFTPPTYQANARLLVEPKSGPGITISQSADALNDLFKLNEGYSIATQMELLQSPPVRKRVMEKLGAPLPQMTIDSILNTTIIVISSEGDNAEVVANAPNYLMEVYINEVANKREQELNKAIKFAKNQAQGALKDRRDLEKKILDFKRKNSVAEVEKNQEIALNTMQEAASRYAASQASIKSLQTRINSTLDQMAKIERENRINDSNVVSSAADPAVQNLRLQIAQLETQKEALQITHRPGSDEMRALDIQLADTAKLLKVASEDYIARSEFRNPLYKKFEDDLVGFDIEMTVLRGQVVDASKSLNDAQKRLAEFPQWELQFREMDQQREAAQARYLSYSTRLDDMQLRLGSMPKPAAVLEPAVVPTTPVRPKKAQNILFAALLGIFLGLGLALLQELFDDRINSPEEAERALKLPNLGHIPLIEEEGLRLIRDISTFSPLMESYRTLRTNINFASVGSTIRSIVVTSSVPAEGKSTTCANLAMAMAMDGKRVVIVDADLRRPNQHHLFKMNSSPGLTDILVGTHTIEEVMRPTNVDNVSIIPAGSPPPNPAELLGSTAMGQFLAAIEAIADIVLLDSPPTLAVADSVVLAARTDGVLLVIGYGETKKAYTRRAKDMLGRANANVLGTVLNRMDGTGTGYYYYGKYYVPAGTAITAGANGAANATAAEDRSLTTGAKARTGRSSDEEDED